jgi:acyl carrier protein
MPNDIIHQTLCREIQERRPDIDASSLRNRTSPLADIGVDSLMVVDLIMAFAERYSADLEVVLDGVEPPQDLNTFIDLISNFQKAA